MSRAAAQVQAGAPAWVMTFADLMSLLMCFFVLLLSFSEMDLNKFKQLAGSMKNAFGVQRQIESKIMPKGTSIIAQEFSPGRPTPSALKVLQQQTTDDTKDNLDFRDSTDKSKGAGEREDQDVSNFAGTAPEIVTVLVEKAPGSEQGEMVKEALKAEIDEGMLQVEVLPGRTIIRIQEKGSFSSGRADLTNQFQPIMQRISDIVGATTGNVVVAGYTDDIPINTARFRSNWELSSARAVTVLHVLLKYNELDQTRFLIEGQADNHPLVPNDTPEGRAHNRRVEIVIEEPLAGSGPGTGTRTDTEATASALSQ
jgi:chemotaxis protein MotB